MHLYPQIHVKNPCLETSTRGLRCMKYYSNFGVISAKCISKLDLDYVVRYNLWAWLYGARGFIRPHRLNE